MTNFRCHVNSQFDIPDTGMTLLSGDGGAGKSTTLLAIIYAMYGKIPAKVKKTTHGRSTCKVVLEYMGMKITRTKPTIVTLEIIDEDADDFGKVYEAGDAQSMVETRVGMTYEEFLVGAFVHGRKSGPSVISMTPTEQLNFISVLSRESAQAAAEAKDKIKIQKKMLDDSLLKLQGEQSSLNKQKEELEATVVDISIPDVIQKGSTPEEIRAAIAELTSVLDRTNKQMAILASRVEKERISQKKKQEIQKKIDALHTEIKQLKSIILTIKPASQEEIDILAEEILSYESTIEHYEEYISYIKDKSVLQEAIDAIEEHTNNRMKELENIVVGEEELENMRLVAEKEEQYAKVYKKNLEIYKETSAKKEEAKNKLAVIFHKIKSMDLAPKKTVHSIKTPKEMINFLKTTVSKLKETHYKALLKIVPRYQCPGCHEMLAIYEDNLVVCDYEEEENADATLIDSMKLSIETLEKYILNIEEESKYFNAKPIELGNEPKDYASLYKDYFSSMSLKEEYDALDAKKLPPSIEKMKSRIADMDLKFKDEGDVQECMDYLKQLKDELKTKLYDQEKSFSLISEHQDHTSSMEAKQHGITEWTKKLSALSYSGEIINLTEAEEKLSRYTRKIVDLNTTITKHREILDGLAEYESQVSIAENIGVLETKIENIQEQGTLLERKLEGSYGLEEAAREAEILVLEETTNTINVNAKTYLDVFFKTPISVRLVCIKNSKTSSTAGYKLQFNTVIEYEGSVYDSVDELSDSERQRCELAFLFAVNDMVGSSILIMDECINCMSPEMNMDILNLIRELCGHKLVLMISHEAVRGVFDAEVPITHTNA